MTNDEAIQDFIAKDYARVVGAVALASGNRGLAEEAVQEALIKAWLRGPRQRPIDSLPSWILTVALNHCRSAFRRRLAERRAMERAASGLVRWSAEPTGVHIDLERGIASLPARQREMAVLRLLLQMSTTETASILGISEGAVKTGLMKARRNLAAALGREDVEVEDAEA